MGAMRKLLWLSVLFVALCACAQSEMVEGGSSETHFLSTCHDGCDEGFSCVCGLCTEACEEGGDSCDGLPGAASCQAAASSSCSTPRVCDVECDQAADCAALSARHTCDVGRCRAPNPAIDSTSDTQCYPEHALRELFKGQPYTDCSPTDDDESTERAWCVNEKLAARASFAIVWRSASIDSAAADGYVGVAGEDGEYTVYKLHYDSFGFTTNDDPYPRMVGWDPCSTFGVDPTGSPSLPGCFSCPTVERPMCGCTLVDGEPTTQCTVLTGSDSSSLLIGKRCITDDDCKLQGSSSGLECHASIGGGVSICTRACNSGCPTGIECAQAAQFSGLLCMRPCTTNADCPLGGECTVETTDASYCE